MPNSVVVFCPACLTKLKLKNRSKLGQRRNCPSCSESFVLQAAENHQLQQSAHEPVLKPRSSRRKINTRISKRNISILAGCSLLILGLAIGAYAISFNSDHEEPLIETVEPQTRTELNENHSEALPNHESEEKAEHQEPIPEQIAVRPEPELSQQPLSQHPVLPEQESRRLPMEPENVTAQVNTHTETSVPVQRTSSTANRNASINWSRFRGPDGSGISNETGLPLEWSATRSIAWKTSMPGPGASSPIVWREHVYLTCYSGYGLDTNSPGNKSGLKRHLVCINRSDGNILWSSTSPAGGKERPYTSALQLHGYATNTPAADESGVYVFYGPSGAEAYSHTGMRKWKTSCGTGNHEWGCSASVVLYRDLVIINAQIQGDSLIALNKQTGIEVWRQRGLAGAFSTPLIADVNGSQELIVQHNHASVSGLDPQRGTRLWECRAFDDYLNASPIAHDGIIYMIGGSSGHAAAVRAGGRGNVTRTHKIWELNKGSYLTASVFYNGHLYWSRHDSGIVYCANARTGKLVYEQRLRPTCGRIYASPVIADEKLYYVSREHGVYVLPAKPEFKILAHNKIQTDNSVFNGSPAVHKGQLLLRSDKFLYSIGVAR